MESVFSVFVRHADLIRHPEGFERLDSSFRWNDVYWERLKMTSIAWLVFIAAAVLEVGGDAVVRKGLRGSGLIIIMIGFAMLGCYGVVVNMVKWDFSKLLGVYVAIFALISILFGRFVFKETIPAATWIGLIVILGGGMIIQFGDKIGI
jgi:small multidrug resistance family-3 protein